MEHDDKRGTAGEGDAEALTMDGTVRWPLSPATIHITNRRYQPDPFWGGPKGIEYGLLVGALPIQQPVLYPDGGSSYFVAQFQLPVGASLTIRGEYGHVRYFSFTVAGATSEGGLGNGDNLRDVDIDPDPGSYNPFDPAQRRDVTPRAYTLQVLQNDNPPPEDDRPPNTLYVPVNHGIGEAPHIHLAIRHYIPDAGYDGTGNVRLDGEGYGLPQVTLTLADGTQQTGHEMAKTLHAKKTGEQAEYTLAQWQSEVNGSTSAPALREPVFQRFWNVGYSVSGAFIADPETRVATYPATNEGGFANNPDTIYMMASFSLEYGEIVVIEGKLPLTPKTRRGDTTWPAEDQVRYWSATSGASPPSGVGWSTVFDEQVPLDADGNYTLVVSWPECRPKNATPEHGVAWLAFGDGEGHYVGARNWVNTVYLRYQVANPRWPRSPRHIPPPTKEDPQPHDAEVMGEYFPRAHYTSKKAFERLHRFRGVCDG